jgi:hypothetical protein
MPRPARHRARLGPAHVGERRADLLAPHVEVVGLDRVTVTAGHQAGCHAVTIPERSDLSSFRVARTLISTAVPGATRQYDSGAALRSDVVDARIWLGLQASGLAGR